MMDAGRIVPWALVLCFVLMPVGLTQASFRLFDAFEDEAVGPIDDQDGWNSGGGDNQVVVDPGGSLNQVLYVPSDSSTLHKSLLGRHVGIPNGTVRMMFMRIRVGNKQTFSSGVTRASYPSEFSDFASEIGMANSAQNLDLRAWDEGDGNYEVVTQLAPDIWYNMWVLMDALQDTYQIWINDAPGSSATSADKLTASDVDEEFEIRSGRNSDLITFFVKTAGGGSSTNFGPVYFDDIYFELTPALNLTNPAVPDTSSEIQGLVLGADKETLLWSALAWADGYDVVRGDLGALRTTAGDFGSSVTECLENFVDDDTAEDLVLPDAAQGFFYVVRGRSDEGITATYDSGGTAQVAPRDPGIAASPGACP